jgi:hypothetical protein
VRERDERDVIKKGERKGMLKRKAKEGRDKKE